MIDTILHNSPSGAPDGLYCDHWRGADASTIPYPLQAHFHHLIVMNFTVPTSQQIGAKAHKIARICATVIVFAYVIAMDVYNLAKVGIKNFTEIAYNAGYNTGTFIHTLNNKLSRISVLIIEHNWTELMTMIKQPTPAPAFYHPLAEIAAEIEQLTVPEIKNILGTKKKVKKQQLIEMMLAV